MIVKVKEPQPQECAMLRPGQLLYTYLHLAPDPEQTAALVKSGAVCVAYETITGANGGLPLLAPMSEVAGRMSIQAGAAHLEKSKGGMGVLLGGVPGVAPGHVAILGAGVVGTHALQCAVGAGARVTVLDKNVDRLRQLDLVFGNRITTLYSNAQSVEESVLAADLVIGGVLIPGAAAPKLVTRDMISRMKKGAVVVDVAIDQGGCFETSHATTHAEPTYVVDGVVHYCVANMPGAVARTSTFALNNATIGARPRAGRPGLAGGDARQSAPEGGAQRGARQGHVRGGGAGAGLRLHAARRAAELSARASAVAGGARQRECRQIKSPDMSRLAVLPQYFYPKRLLTLYAGFMARHRVGLRTPRG